MYPTFANGKARCVHYRTIRQCPSEMSSPVLSPGSGLDVGGPLLHPGQVNTDKVVTIATPVGTPLYEWLRVICPPN